MEILFFTGLSAVGKSTLAAELGQRIDLPVIKEKVILHNLAISRGFSRTRFWLAQEGDKPLLDSGRLEMIAQVKDLENLRGVIIDGCYDSNLQLELQKTIPSVCTTVVLVTISEEERQRRMGCRLNNTSLDAIDKEMFLLDSFKKRAGIEEVMNGASITIDNTLSIKESLSKLIEVLGSRQSSLLLSRRD